jgi:hypothetical protein
MDLLSLLQNIPLIPEVALQLFPPILSCFSIKTTLNPFYKNKSALTMPANPDPTIIIVLSLFYFY